MNIKKIIALISLGPIWLNKLLLKLNAWPFFVFGRKYKIFFSDFEKFSERDFIDFFNKNTLGNEFYNKRYNHSVEIKTLSQFKENVPFIDKDIVLSGIDILVASDMSGADVCTTGGTSGKPLKIYLPKSRFANEFGALHALWSKIGYNFSIRAVVRNEKLHERDFLINPITKEFIFDGFRTDKAYLRIIYNVMREYQIPFYHGYTSNAERFISFILDQNLDYSFLKGVITSSENFYYHQKILFKKLVGVKHMNFFGHSEKLILGGWCEAGNCYHFYNSYGYAELIDENGADVSEDGKIGELVGSTNYNGYMPLFRYKTGDFARKAPDVCPCCGFVGLSAYEIFGRWKGDRIYNKNGSYVTTTALNLHSEIYEYIEALQYYQPEKGVLQIRVVPSSMYSQVIERELISTVSEKLDLDSVVNVVLLSEIDKTQNGKYSLLISDVV